VPLINFNCFNASQHVSVTCLLSSWELRPCVKLVRIIRVIWRSHHICNQKYMITDKGLGSLSSRFECVTSIFLCSHRLNLGHNPLSKMLGLPWSEPSQYFNQLNPKTNRSFNFRVGGSGFVRTGGLLKCGDECVKQRLISKMFYHNLPWSFFCKLFCVQVDITPFRFISHFEAF